MNDIGRVQKVNGTQHVVHDCNHMLLREGVAFDPCENAIQILVVVVHDYEYVLELVFAVLTFLGRDDDVKKLRGE